MTHILILAAALLALLWWRATAPRRREIDDWHRAHTYVEPEDGVQVDPRPAELLWSGPTDYEYTLSQLGHEPLPHVPGEWTPGCRRCDMLIERLIADIQAAR